MPRGRITQTSFTAGVLDARMIARADLQGIYDKGIQRGDNVLSIPYGGLSKRIGTRYIDDIAGVDASAIRPRLIKFEFSTTQTYLFILSDRRLIIYRDGNLVTNINGSGNDYLTIPYTAAQIANVDYTQSADTMFMVHPDVAPRILRRGNAHNMWTISNLTFEVQPTYDFGTVNYANTTFTIPAGGDFGAENVTATTAAFTQAHVNGSFRTIDGYARITSVAADGRSATLDIRKDLDALVHEGDEDSGGNVDDMIMLSGQTVSIEEPAFNSTHGYPRSVVLHEGRLWFGGTRSLPQTVWASNTGLFFNFELGEGLPDEAIQLSLDTNEVNAISHMVSGRYLQLFTSGATFYVRTAEAGPITPADNAATRVESYGSKATVKPVVIETQTLYIDRADVHLRSFFYDFSQDGFANDTVSIRAPDLLKTVVDIEVFTRFGREEGNYMIAVNTDGTMAILNILSTENIKAWTSMSLGGNLRATNVREVEGVIYILVNNLTTNTYSLMAFQENTYTDANTVFTRIFGATAGGLERFNGREVTILADGILQPPQTVSGGLINLPEDPNNNGFDRVEVGLPYSVDVELMPAVASDGQGAGLIEQKRVTQVEVFLSEETLGLTINGRRQPDRNFGPRLLNQAPTGRTQVRRTPVLGFSRVNSTRIGQTDPLPWQVLAVVQQIYI